MEDFFKQIIEQVKETLLDGIDEKYHEEILNRYEQLLRSEYEGLKVKDGYFEVALQDEVQVRNKELSRMGAWGKLSFYLEDKPFQELIEISNTGLKFAIKRYTTGEIQEKTSATEYIKKMEGLLDKVREFNKISAHITYGDGILDFNYACGNESIFSLRMTPYVISRRNQKEKGEER